MIDTGLVFTVSISNSQKSGNTFFIGLDGGLL
jgi:hypothetical protein